MSELRMKLLDRMARYAIRLDRDDDTDDVREQKRQHYILARMNLMEIPEDRLVECRDWTGKQLYNVLAGEWEQRQMKGREDER